MNPARPTGAENRIISLDVLRGVALLGIFIMNMISFSMVGSNYMNPHAEGVLEGADQVAFIFSQLFAHEKFMSLFSILFGAGVVLFTERVLNRGESEAKWHYRRNFWLFVVGMLHAYCIWMGDILVSYAMCSIWVFFFRNFKSKKLFILSGLFFIAPIILNLFIGWSIPYWEAGEFASLQEVWAPSSEEIVKELAAMRGSWLDQMPLRAEGAISIQTFLFIFLGWQITSMMLLGMGLYKSGVITGAKSKHFYKRLMITGLGLGVSIGVWGLLENYEKGWSCEYSLFYGNQFNYVGSLPMVLGYVGLIMLLCSSSAQAFLSKWIAPVGRMAFTNYLMQSIIATTIFYGHGFGLFGTIGRAEHWLVIIPVWTAQIVISKWWLEKYKFGPAEWGWRTLTYGKAQLSAQK